MHSGHEWAPIIRLADLDVRQINKTMPNPRLKIVIREADKACHQS